MTLSNLLLVGLAGLAAALAGATVILARLLRLGQLEILRALDQYRAFQRAVAAGRCPVCDEPLAHHDAAQWEPCRKALLDREAR